MTAATTPTYLPPPPRYHLSDFFRRAGGFLGEPPPGPGGGRRMVDMVDFNSRPVDDEAVPAIHAAIDGVEGRLLVARREHRPICLHYVAAAAITPKGQLASRLWQHLEVVGSYKDEAWLEQIVKPERGEPIPVTIVDTHWPWMVAEDAAALCDQRRRDTELEAYLGCEAPPVGSMVIVDGTLADRPVRPGFCSVAKTVAASYIPEGDWVYDLPVGWMSPTFCLKPDRRGEAERFSAYLRLNSGPSPAELPWEFGLVRMEAWEPQLLGPLAARLLQDRVGPALDANRWPVHTRSVVRTEHFLKAKRPAHFTM